MRYHAISALLVVAGTAAAQGPGARVSPQFVSYTLGAPSSVTITEMAVPFFAYMAVTPGLTIDIGSAFASARVKNTGGTQATESTISGLTDTQIRATMNVGSDMVLVTAGVNIPTGSSTAGPAEQSAASQIGNDFLFFPISSMGSGFGGTGGIALARPIGDWNLGAGLSIRHSMPFDPYEDAAGTKLRYTPGDEMRARLGVDHPFGTGRASLGVTYSRFTDDKIAGSIYNTGNRLLSAASVSNSMWGGDYMLSAWNLFRASGTLADGSASGTESITDVSAAYGMSLAGGRVEPGLSVRTWTQENAAMSLQSTASLRYERSFGRLTMAPGVGFTIGKVATGVTETASITGFRAQLTFRAQ